MLMLGTCGDNPLNKFIKSQEFKQAGKRREALGNFTSASSYYFNVNRTSLDHLLLGKCADVDKSVESPEYIARSERCQRKRFLGTGSVAGKHCRNSPNARELSTAPYD